MRCHLLGRAIIAGAGLAFALAGVGATDSHANGRTPATVSVRFQPGAPETILVPVTFGLLISRDGGESFRWVCENAVGYSGTFDPDYAVTGDGRVYATTFDGLKVSRDDGCSFEEIGDPVGANTFESEVEIGPDGRVWTATANGEGSNDVYVSEDGSTFRSSNLFDADAWWVSLRTTPADPMRIYVSGLVPRQGPSDGGTPAQALLRRSDDGGANWQVLPVDGFAFGDEPRLYILGASPAKGQADVVFARVVAGAGLNGDVLYRSADGGQTWEQKLRFGDTISAFVIRADGQTVIAGSTSGCPEDSDPASKGCVYISSDAGVTWELTTEQPRLACIGERDDGTLFGCGANWVPDNFALGSSSDGKTWQKVYRFIETAGPLECPSDSPQSDCAALLWPDLCIMFGICDTGEADAGEGDGRSGGAESGGCCKVGGSTDAGWVPGLVLVLLFLAWRSRARRRTGGRVSPPPET